MNKSILFLCGYKSVYGGNFIPSICTLGQRLSENGYKTVYVFPEEAKQREWFDQLVVEGLCVEVIKYPNGVLNFISDLERLCTKYNVGLIHSHFIRSTPLEFFSFKNNDIKILIHLHSDFSAGQRSVKRCVQDFVVYHVLASHVKFLSVSEAFVRCNPKRITWIPNGLATKRIACKHYGRQEMRRMLGIKEEDYACEIFAWSPTVKGLDIAVNAVYEFNKRSKSKLYLCIICGREMTIDKMIQWVSDNTLCSGKSENLIFLEPREDVFAFHEAVDFLVSSSRSEGFPYAVLEMLGLGKACVTSDIPGVSWAKRYQTVYTFEPENYIACEEAIEKLVAQLPIMDTSVKDEIRDKYSIDKWVDNVISKYNL